MLSRGIQSKEPFDLLAEGLLWKVCQDDKMAIEPAGELDG
jgi:hypothetical protein